MMETRKKIFILLSVLVLFILAFILLYFFFYRSKPAQPTVEETSTATSTTEIPATTQNTVVAPVKNTPPPPPTTTEERERLYVKQLARTFVERFETSSSQNKNRNIEDATALSTANMASYIATKAQAQTGEYTGVTAKVISMEVLSFDGASASVKIGAQLETQTRDSSQTSYKNGRVDLKKVDGVWKVDGLFWESA